MLNQQMEKFEPVFVIICILNIIHPCQNSRGKRKRASDLILKEKIAEYEKEHYEVYSRDTELYTEWPEMKISEQLNKDTCKTYIGKLYQKKDFTQCTITPSIKLLNLYYLTPIFSSVGHLIDGPIILKTLECYIDPPVDHRKYFYFLRTSKPECLYLVNRQRPNRMDFNISLRFCMYHTYNHLKYNETLEGAVYTQRSLGVRKKCRDNDNIMEQEDYERNHYLWITQGSIKADTWPELEGENQRIFCSKLLGKLYTQSIFPIRIHTSFYSEQLSYTKLRNVNGFGFLLVKVVVISCNTTPMIRKGGHLFIRAPNNGPLSCVYMIRREKFFYNHHQIVKRLCIQKLYENKGQVEQTTVPIGVNQQVNNENVSGPITTKESYEDSLRPTHIEELISDEEVLRHITFCDSTVSIDELMKSSTGGGV